MVKLVGGGSVINGAYPVYFYIKKRDPGSQDPEILSVCFPLQGVNFEVHSMSPLF